MKDSDLREGLSWLAKQTWIDDILRKLATDALATLK
jgi:hypothetical protein